ncbi:uncharacterized protein LOC132251171 [Alligator mississippiensis]|uniref:uncharacterized protein LOC132251171 n=1 Tax=Alligator mississippiensis TaxID=8496 RepID=UPI0028774C9B|nr:uncharacterized protein LOC132251171 [Alligator mississippiensis]
MTPCTIGSYSETNNTVSLMQPMIQPTDYYPMVLIHVGTNDAARSPDHLVMDDHALGGMLREIGAQVVFSSVLPVSGRGRRHVTCIRETNWRLWEWCLKAGFGFLDNNPHNRTRDMLRWDGLHLSPTGGAQPHQGRRLVGSGAGHRRPRGGCGCWTTWVTAIIACWNSPSSARWQKSAARRQKSAARRQPRTSVGQISMRDQISPSARTPSGPRGGTPRPRVSDDLVRELLEGLDVFKSAGLDNLHPRVLRELAEVIAGPLAPLYEHSWCSGVVPEAWKRANVVPIFKKGRKEDPGNYRPVSLTSILGKLSERIILARVHEGPAGEVMLRGNQHGFIRGRSYQTNLVAFYDQVTKSLDAGVAVDVVFLDFRKAFDTVSHPILIKK